MSAGKSFLLCLNCLHKYSLSCLITSTLYRRLTSRRLYSVWYTQTYQMLTSRRRYIVWSTQTYQILTSRRLYIVWYTQTYQRLTSRRRYMIYRQVQMLCVLIKFKNDHCRCFCVTIILVIRVLFIAYTTANIMFHTLHELICKPYSAEALCKHFLCSFERLVCKRSWFIKSALQFGWICYM